MTRELSKANIAQRQEHFIIDYPQAVQFRNDQLAVMWLPDEVRVENDVQDILVNMTPAEKHAVLTTLKLFTKYELLIGDDFWSNRIMREFPRPDIQGMASTFATTELAVHAPFYNKINEALSINTEAFYNEYKEDKVLADRIRFIDECLESDDLAMALAAFTFIEGVVLYSSFAFLKHFQSKGKNKLLNIVSGINFSVRDENLHSIASGWLFQTLLSELGKTPEEYFDKIRKVADTVLGHEIEIINKLFEKGPIEGITELQITEFVKSRINKVMEYLGLPKLYEVKNREINSWFYDSINGYSSGDFFSSQNNQYTRKWNETEFKWAV